MARDEPCEEDRKQLDPDEKVETTFRRLRRDGHSRLEAIRIILELLDLSLAEAKRVLLTSKTWGDAFDETKGTDDSSSSPVPPAPG